MFELLINPAKSERRPWELFFVGAFYAALSLLLVNWVFAKDPVLSQYAGIFLVTFTVMFSLPFVYYSIRHEESKIVPSRGAFALLREHQRSIMAFLWLFVGFVVAFSLGYVFLAQMEATAAGGTSSAANSFKAQIETFCLINRPANFQECIKQYGLGSTVSGTAFVTNPQRFLLIFTNNIYVLIFTLVFSLIFGAGVIFVLAWNASVIAAAVGIFTQKNLSALPIGLGRYLIHGIPEIGAYFIVALAGGLISVAVIKHEVGTEKFWEVLQDSLNLILFAVGVLLVAALLEVYVTPLFFSV